MLLIFLDWNSLLSGVVGAVVGRLIAAVSTMWAAGRSTNRAFTHSRELQDEADRELTRRFLLAINAEVETIWTGYEREVGHNVAALVPPQGLNLTYKLRQQYFTVYDASAQFLLPGARIRFTEHIEEYGERLFNELESLELEGMVCKRKNSVYAHSRSKHWLKIKTGAGKETMRKRIEKW